MDIAPSNTDIRATSNTLMEIDDADYNGNISPPNEICATTFNFNGYEYVQQSKPKFNSTAKTWVRYYRCKYYRAPLQCKATLSVKMTPDDVHNGTTSLKSGTGKHTCDVRLCPASAGIQDVSDEMMADINNRAVVQCTASALDLANEVRMDFEKRYSGSPVVLLNIQQLQSAVYRARTKAFSDWESFGVL
jgi:hypothetical protein